MNVTFTHEFSCCLFFFFFQWNCFRLFLICLSVFRLYSQVVFETQFQLCSRFAHRIRACSKNWQNKHENKKCRKMFSEKLSNKYRISSKWKTIAFIMEFRFIWIINVRICVWFGLCVYIVDFPKTFRKFTIGKEFGWTHVVTSQKFSLQNKI